MNAPIPHNLGGVEKAAALLLAMGKPLASRLLKHFDEADLRRLTQAAAGLKPLPTTSLEKLVDEFASNFSAGADVIGDPEAARKLLDEVLPPELVSDIMADVTGGSKESFWVKAANLPDARLAACLQEEHPQVAAFILDRFDSARVAALLVLLPPQRRDLVAERLIGLRRVSDRVLHLIEVALEQDLFGAEATAAPAQPEARLLEIVSKLDREKVEEMIVAFETTRPAVARKIREKLFSFADIVALSQRDRMVLFDKAPTESVILALKDTSQEFRDAVLSSLAARARRMVEAELKNADSVADKDVAAARRAIERIVVDLIDQGAIQRPQAGGDGAA
ncbi:MAG: flagellar motor switch protein FliG [Methylobacteriaceae bacterium]|nr:flagellar motor switch protein FliG [Methylobacteriaceae bacterium]